MLPFFGATFSLTEHVDLDMYLLWADSTRFLGGESGWFKGFVGDEHDDEDKVLLCADSTTSFWGGEGNCVVGAVLKVRRELTGIPCDWGAGFSIWKRDLLWVDCRGGRKVAAGSEEGVVAVAGEVGEDDGVELRSDGLTKLDNHLWIASAGVWSGEAGVSVCWDADLSRVCFTDLLRISPLNPSNDLCLQ